MVLIEDLAATEQFDVTRDEDEAFWAWPIILLLVGPEPASVLATVITRHRGVSTGTIPLVARYDPHELVTGPPLPHLFQRRIRRRRDVISTNMLYQLRNDALARAALTDQAGEPLLFTPHDFRRIFATEAAAGGLPVHQRRRDNLR